MSSLIFPFLSLLCRLFAIVFRHIRTLGLLPVEPMFCLLSVSISCEHALSLLPFPAVLLKDARSGRRATGKAAIRKAPATSATGATAWTFRDADAEECRGASPLGEPSTTGKSSPLVPHHRPTDGCQSCVRERRAITIIRLRCRLWCRSPGDHFCPRESLGLLRPPITTASA